MSHALSGYILPNSWRLTRDAESGRSHESLIAKTGRNGDGVTLFRVPRTAVTEKLRPTSRLQIEDCSHLYRRHSNFISLLNSTLTVKMSPNNLPPIFNATSQDIEMLLAAQCHLGSKNLQVHMEPYLWKTRPDGINVINIGKTW